MQNRTPFHAALAYAFPLVLEFYVSIAISIAIAIASGVTRGD